MRIMITMDIDGEYVDPGHPIGVTEAGYDALTAALSSLGDNIDVSRAEA